MKEIVSVSRLDKILSLWEDLKFLASIRERVQLQLSGRTNVRLESLTNAGNFRKYILEYKGGNFDFLRFFDETSDMAMEVVPISILSWNHHSRRIFNLTSDIQTLLDSTSLGGIKWEDIKFPFDSFLIQLAEPLKSDDGMEYKDILLSRIDQFLGSSFKKGTILELRLLPTSLDKYTPISQLEKKRVEAKLHNRDYQEIMRLVQSRSWVKCKSPTIHFFPNMLSGLTIRDSLPRLGELTNQPDMVKEPVVDSALHIALNLCLYLENYAAHTLVKRKPKKPIQKKKAVKGGFDYNAVRDELDIFTVNCEFKMSRAEIDQLVREEKEAKAGSPKGTHWRRAHWRRKPYFGHIPMKIAPKDWIPRVLVNASKLPADSLPQGSKAMLE